MEALLKWRVENSWSEAAGEKGYFVMTDVSVKVRRIDCLLTLYRHGLTSLYIKWLRAVILSARR